MAEARVNASLEINDENKENNPSEIAVLQQTVNKLNSELHELRVVTSNKEAELTNLNTAYSQLQSQLQNVVGENETKLFNIVIVISPKTMLGGNIGISLFVRPSLCSFFLSTLDLSYHRTNLIQTTQIDTIYSKDVHTIIVIPP